MAQKTIDMKKLKEQQEQDKKNQQLKTDATVTSQATTTIRDELKSNGTGSARSGATTTIPITKANELPKSVVDKIDDLAKKGLIAEESKPGFIDVAKYAYEEYTYELKSKPKAENALLKDIGNEEGRRQMELDAKAAQKKTAKVTPKAVMSKVEWAKLSKDERQEILEKEAARSAASITKGKDISYGGKSGAEYSLHATLDENIGEGASAWLMDKKNREAAAKELAKTIRKYGSGEVGFGEFQDWVEKQVAGKEAAKKAEPAVKAEKKKGEEGAMEQAAARDIKAAKEAAAEKAVSMADAQKLANDTYLKRKAELDDSAAIKYAESIKPVLQEIVDGKMTEVQAKARLEANFNSRVEEMARGTKGTQINEFIGVKGLAASSNAYEQVGSLMYALQNSGTTAGVNAGKMTELENLRATKWMGMARDEEKTLENIRNMQTEFMWKGKQYHLNVDADGQIIAVEGPKTGKRIEPKAEKEGALKTHTEAIGVYNEFVNANEKDIDTSKVPPEGKDRREFIMSLVGKTKEEADEVLKTKLLKEQPAAGQAEKSAVLGEAEAKKFAENFYIDNKDAIDSANDGRPKAAAYVAAVKEITGKTEEEAERILRVRMLKEKPVEQTIEPELGATRSIGAGAKVPAAAAAEKEAGPLDTEETKLLNSTLDDFYKQNAAALKGFGRDKETMLSELQTEAALRKDNKYLDAHGLSPFSSQEDVADWLSETQLVAKPQAAPAGEARSTATVTATEATGALTARQIDEIVGTNLNTLDESKSPGEYKKRLQAKVKEVPEMSAEQATEYLRTTFPKKEAAASKEIEEDSTLGMTELKDMMPAADYNKLMNSDKMKEAVSLKAEAEKEEIVSKTAGVWPFRREKTAAELGTERAAYVNPKVEVLGPVDFTVKGIAYQGDPELDKTGAFVIKRIRKAEE